MRKITRFVLLVVFMLFSYHAFAEEYTINVAKAGSLSTLMTETQVSNVTKLTLTGLLCDPDIWFIGNICEQNKLTDLDLGGASFVLNEDYGYTVRKDSIISNISN